MQEQRPTIDFVWNLYNAVLWNIFKKNEMGDVMLPFIVLRRMDCMLESTKKAVREAYLQFGDKVATENLAPILKKAAGGLSYYNTSPYDLKSLTQDAQNIEINFRSYINGFSAEVSEILENFQVDKIIAKLVRNGVLYKLVEAMSSIDLHANAVSNHNMGYIFEEIIRIANEQSNETAGEHFTPREVIKLMAHIVFATETESLKQPGIIRTIYDCACGTGGMLTIAKNHILEHINPGASIGIFGQEINEQSFAIAKSDLLITGENPDNIRHGNTFTEDKFPGRQFNYLFANPPYGVSWKKDEREVKSEALTPGGRFDAGLPASSDGQLLFIQHMVSKMDRKGARAAVVTNGSPLFSGSAGGGESEIRKWVISSDLLDCIIALPGELFYNTGIPTYIWLLDNNKAPHRRGKVQLIDGSGFWKPMKKSLGNKRRRISEENIAQMEDLYTAFEAGAHCKIFDNEAFGYFKVTVEQPELDSKGKVKRDKDGKLKADSKKRDTEYIPLTADIEDYFAGEIRPHVPDGWIDRSKTKIGYEVNFTKYFYQYRKPESAAELKADIVKLEKDIAGKLAKLLAD